MNPGTALSGLQTRVRDLLRADPYFSAAAILTADDAGLADAVDQALGALGWVITIAIVEGDRAEDSASLLKVRARVRVAVASNPTLEPETHALAQGAMPEVIRVLEGQPVQPGARTDKELGLRLISFENVPMEGVQVRATTWAVVLPFGRVATVPLQGTPLLLEDGVHGLEVA